MQFLGRILREGRSDAHLKQDGPRSLLMVDPFYNKLTFEPKRSDRVMPRFGMTVFQKQADLTANASQPVVQVGLASLRPFTVLTIRRTVSPKFFTPPSALNVRMAICSMAITCTSSGNIIALSN